MKSVLLSIKPQWCELIASGKKTIEVRKTKPKLETPFKVYIYETKDKKKYYNIFHENTIGKVIGEFVCDCIANYDAELHDDETFERIREFYESDDFAEDGEYEYKTIADNSDDFWKENMLCKASCLTIEELRAYLGAGITEFYGWHISNLVIYAKPKELSNFIKPCIYGEESDVSCFLCEKSGYRTGMYIDCFNTFTRPPQSWCYVEEYRI